MRIHVVVPEGFDDPGQPTGGNIYDRRVCAGLAEAGWEVLVATVAAAWPVPGPGDRADLARIVSAIPDGETVLIDGLIASPAAAQLLPHTGRIRMTVLLHMPLATPLDTHHDASAERSERAVLDLKVPGDTPGWLAQLGTAIVRPFGSIDEWIMRRRWEAIRAAMREELADLSWTELFFGTAFLAAGSRGPGICGVRPRESGHQ